jgi:uncharacterized membrane protein (UPF0127 family)
MKIRRTVWGIIVVAAATTACSDTGDAAQNSPRSVLTTERGQEVGENGGMRPGEGGVVRTTRLVVNGVEVVAEIADTPALRERGLMGRDSLETNHGMLFVYPDEQERSFWMRNTPLALDIAFLDRTGTIINIATMKPHDDSSTLSSAPAMYALEMTAGWFEANGVPAGAHVQL